MMRSPDTRRRRRLLPVAVTVLAAAAALTACGTSSSSAGAGSATSGSITWWGWTPTNEGAQTYIKAFNKAYPGIHVTFKELTIAGYDAAMRPALASSVGPDVFDIAPGGGIGSIAELAPDTTNIAPAIAKALGPGWKSKIAPIGPAGLTTPSGKLAALPIGSTFAGNLWINQDLFRKYGLTPPTTLASWAHVCSVFKQHGVGCFVQGAGQVAFNQDTLQEIADSVQPGVWTKASKGQLSWDNPTIVKALTIWKQMFTDGIMEPGALGVQQYPDASNDFMSGKYAMVMMGTWYMQYATQAGMPAAIAAAGVGDPKPFTLVAIPFPDVAGAGNPATMFGDADYGIAVNRKSSHQAAATTFAVWLTTSAAGAADGGEPAERHPVGDEHPARLDDGQASQRRDRASQSPEADRLHRHQCRAAAFPGQRDPPAGRRRGFDHGGSGLGHARAGGGHAGEDHEVAVVVRTGRKSVRRKR